jgi:hypothetical protein
MNVSAVTRHLFTPLAIIRTAAHTEYIQQAVEPAPDAPDLPQLLRNLQRSLQNVWKLPWEAEYKDTLWRLAVNGIQGAGGAGICFARSCPCGYAMTPYHWRHNHSHLHHLHSFWSCPVAVAIRRQLETHLNTPQLSRSALWLLTPPTHHINTGVWQVVCTAAISAMDLGRRCMWSAKMDMSHEPVANLGPKFLSFEKFHMHGKARVNASQRKNGVAGKCQRFHGVF